MLKRASQFREQLGQLADGLLTVAAFTAALAVRRGLNYWRPDLFPPFDALWQHAWLYVLLIPLWLITLDLGGYYQHPFARTPLANLGLLIRANLASIVVTFFVLYVLKVKHIPRVLIVLLGIFDVILLWLKDCAMRRLAPRWSTPAHLLLIGDPREFKGLEKSFQQMPSWSAKILGVLTPDRAAPDSAGGGAMTVLGSVDQLTRILHEQPVDSVLLAPGRQSFEEIQTLIRVCETEGVEAMLLANFFRTSIARPHVDWFQDRPVLVFRSTPSLSWALLLKRLMDLAGSLALLTLFSPLLLAIAAAIRWTSPGPVLFRQKRCTLHGRVFTMLKFRTMVADAENRRGELEALNEVSGPVFKIRDDPRITPVGRFLRRHSMDELPQLFNVLAGDMSLVGPRPPIPAEVAKYENWQRRRLSMKAGLTCLWQVSGRNALPFEDWMRLDLEYIDRWSLGLDLRILLATPWTVLRGTGL